MTLTYLQSARLQEGSMIAVLKHDKVPLVNIVGAKIRWYYQTEEKELEAGREHVNVRMIY